jgi:NADH-ubiquinone oxidoreductase chain 5
MYLLIILIPLINFIYLSCFGRYLGKEGSIYFSIFNITLIFIFSFRGFIKVGIKKNYRYIILGNWINSDLLAIKWGFLFDSLTISMFVIVAAISMLVHIYSVSYMQSDPHMPRFLSYLSLFTFFMLILVSADNFLQLFLGWEGVGLCSYLLINF